MSKKNKPEEIPSWIKDLYKEDLDRVVRGERPMYFRGMDDSPLRNVSPEFDILSGGTAVKGMNGIRGALSPLNNGMGNYNFSLRGINKKIGELVDEAGLYLPEKLRPVYRTVVDAMSRSKDKGLGVYDVYDFHGDDQEFPVNVATNVLDAIGDKFEERGSFEDHNPLLESGKDALIRNAIMSKNKLEDKAEGGRINTGSDYGSGKYVIDPRRSENSKMAVYDEIWDYLTEKKGIPQTQAIGILSNIAAESGGDTEALGAAGDFGIQQWLGPRKKELQRRYGRKPTLTQQLDYLVDEYQGKVPGLGWNYINQGKFFDKDAQGNEYNYYMYSKSDFDNAVNYKDATVAWNQGYGRPLGSTLRNEKRFEFADMFSNRYGVPENEPMRYEFGQRDSGTGDGGQQPVPETVAPADPSLASRQSMDIWWEKEGQDLLYKMLAQSGANKKAIEDIANNIKNDPQSEAQIAEAERMRKEQAKRQLVLNMIPGLMLNIKGMSSIKSEGGPVGDDKWFYDKDQRKRIVDKQEAIRALSKERHKILNASRSAF